MLSEAGVLAIRRLIGRVLEFVTGTFYGLIRIDLCHISAFELGTFT